MASNASPVLFSKLSGHLHQILMPSRLLPSDFLGENHPSAPVHSSVPIGLQKKSTHFKIMNKIQEMSFIPRDLMLVMVGRHSTNVCPKVEAKMPVYEHTFAYQVSKSALESLPIDIRLIIKAMAMQLNCNATANGLI
jgi:hypothetical protein